MRGVVSLALVMSLPVMGADILLSDGSTLSGELVAMDDAGTVVLDSPLSEKPLMLRGDRVKQVGFKGEGGAAGEVSGQRVELTNGDVLPVTIQSLDDEGMKVSSQDAGELWIPRGAISSVQLGVFDEKLVYSGGDDLDGWEQQGGRESWISEGEGLVAESSGSIMRDVDLPEKFILRFRMGWSKQPSFRLFFADTLPGKSGSADRYFFDFNGASISIHRDSEALGKSKPMMVLGRTGELIAENMADVEIRGDLERGFLHLYLNGSLQGRFADPLPNVPRGSGITLMSRSPQNSLLTISDIQVAEWDERSDRHRGEERGDDSSDAMIGRYGQRFGGKLLGIRTEEGRTMFEFKSDFQKAALVLPESEVSTVFFRGEKDFSADGGGLVLRLRGAGELQLSSCVFEPEKVSAVHPLLGEIQVNRAGITALEKRDIPKAKPIKE